MKRKRKATRKRRTPIELMFEQKLRQHVGKRIDFLVQEVEHQYREIAQLREGITILIDLHKRRIRMEDERLRDAIKDQPDAAPPTPAK